MIELASAPGKLIALGEYAILEGASALVLAVDRRAVAHVADADAGPLSPFLAAAEALCLAETGERGPSIRVDTSCFREGQRKLGLGSSAAATAAYVAARLAGAGGDASRLDVHRIAHRAHGEVSAAGGARGSGADVAASVWGGALRVTPRDGGEPDASPLPHAAFTWVALDSGRAADTRVLVAQVQAFAARDRRGHRDHIDRIAAAAAAGCVALEDEDGSALFAAFEAGLEALDALGAASGLELITEVHRNIAKTARNHGGAAKSTGAGGGDAALAVFSDAAAAGRFCAEMVAGGIQPLGLSVSVEGILLFPSPPVR